MDKLKQTKEELDQLNKDFTKLNEDYNKIKDDNDKLRNENEMLKVQTQNAQSSTPYNEEEIIPKTVSTITRILSENKISYELNLKN